MLIPIFAAIGRSRRNLLDIPSWKSRGSVGSALSVRSAFSFLSVGSALSAGSALSLGSAGSILSIGSVGSILSIGSAGSILSIGSVGSLLAVGKASGARRAIAATAVAGRALLESGALQSLLQAATRRAVA